MPDFNAWLGTSETDVTHEALWAAAAWRRINDMPTSVTFTTSGGTVLAAQTVRLELSSSGRDVASPAGTQQARELTIFGVRDHETVTDTDVKSGYTFVLNNNQYRVLDVVNSLGEVQARAQRVS